VNKEIVRESLIDLIEICDNCIRILDEDDQEPNPTLKFSVVLRLASLGVIVNKLAKEVESNVSL
jgi:hypothetical protein